MKKRKKFVRHLRKVSFIENKSINHWNYLDDLKRIYSFDPHKAQEKNFDDDRSYKKSIASVCGWRCRKDPKENFSIWFNAWKFDQEEQLWAAIALSLIEEVKQRYNFFQLVIFWIRLSIKRFSLKGFVGFLINMLFISFVLLAGFFFWLYSLSSNGDLFTDNNTLSGLVPLLSNSSNIWNYLIIIGSIVSLFITKGAQRVTNTPSFRVGWPHAI